MSPSEAKDNQRPADQEKVPAVEQAKSGLPSGGAQASASAVDLVRDALFGSQMRDYEARFARLEENLAAFQTHMKKELESLQALLKAEREERTEALKALSKDLKDSLQNKLAEIDDRISELLYQQLREQICAQSKDLGEQIQRGREQLTALEKRFEEFQTGKADRAALADLLSEFAMRLKDDAAGHAALEVSARRQAV